jgi:hypothetical protein
MCRNRIMVVAPWIETMGARGPVRLDIALNGCETEIVGGGALAPDSDCNRG